MAKILTDEEDKKSKENMHIKSKTSFLDNHCTIITTMIQNFEDNGTTTLSILCEAVHNKLYQFTQKI